MGNCLSQDSISERGALLGLKRTTSLSRRSSGTKDRWSLQSYEPEVCTSQPMQEDGTAGAAFEAAFMPLVRLLSAYFKDDQTAPGRKADAATAPRITTLVPEVLNALRLFEKFDRHAGPAPAGVLGVLESLHAVLLASVSSARVPLFVPADVLALLFLSCYNGVLMLRLLYRIDEPERSRLGKMLTVQSIRNNLTAAQLNQEIMRHGALSGCQHARVAARQDVTSALDDALFLASHLLRDLSKCGEDISNAPYSALGDRLQGTGSWPASLQVRTSSSSQDTHTMHRAEGLLGSWRTEQFDSSCVNLEVLAGASSIPTTLPPAHGSNAHRSVIGCVYENDACADEGASGFDPLAETVTTSRFRAIVISLGAAQAQSCRGVRELASQTAATLTPESEAAGQLWQTFATSPGMTGWLTGTLADQDQATADLFVWELAPFERAGLQAERRTDARSHLAKLCERGLIAPDGMLTRFLSMSSEKSTRSSVATLALVDITERFSYALEVLGTAACADAPSHHASPWPPGGALALSKEGLSAADQIRQSLQQLSVLEVDDRGAYSGSMDRSATDPFLSGVTAIAPEEVFGPGSLHGNVPGCEAGPSRKQPDAWPPSESHERDLARIIRAPARLDSDTPTTSTAVQDARALPGADECQACRTVTPGATMPELRVQHKLFNERGDAEFWAWCPAGMMGQVYEGSFGDRLVTQIIAAAYCLGIVGEGWVDRVSEKASGIASDQKARYKAELLASVLEVLHNGSSRASMRDSRAASSPGTSRFGCARDSRRAPMPMLHKLLLFSMQRAGAHRGAQSAADLARAVGRTSASSMRALVRILTALGLMRITGDLAAMPIRACDLVAGTLVVLYPDDSTRGLKLQAAECGLVLAEEYARQALAAKYTDVVAMMSALARLLSELASLPLDLWASAEKVADVGFIAMAADLLATVAPHFRDTLGALHTRLAACSADTRPIQADSTDSPSGESVRIWPMLQELLKRVAVSERGSLEGGRVGSVAGARAEPARLQSKRGSIVIESAGDGDLRSLEQAWYAKLVWGRLAVAVVKCSNSAPGANEQAQKLLEHLKLCLATELHAGRDDDNCSNDDALPVAVTSSASALPSSPTSRPDRELDQTCVWARELADQRREQTDSACIERTLAEVRGMRDCASLGAMDRVARDWCSRLALAPPLTLAIFTRLTALIQLAQVDLKLGLTIAMAVAHLLDDKSGQKAGDAIAHTLDSRSRQRHSSELSGPSQSSSCYRAASDAVVWPWWATQAEAHLSASRLLCTEATFGVVEGDHVRRALIHAAAAHEIALANVASGALADAHPLLAEIQIQRSAALVRASRLLREAPLTELAQNSLPRQHMEATVLVLNDLWSPRGEDGSNSNACEQWVNLPSICSDVAGRAFAAAASEFKERRLALCPSTNTLAAKLPTLTGTCNGEHDSGRTSKSSVFDTAQDPGVPGQLGDALSSALPTVELSSLPVRSSMDSSSLAFSGMHEREHCGGAAPAAPYKADQKAAETLLEADKELAEALRVNSAVLGTSHALVARLQSALAAVMQTMVADSKAGNFQQALQALNQRIALLGFDSPVVLDNVAVLVTEMVEQGRARGQPEQLRNVLESLLDLSRQCHGIDSQACAQMSNRFKAALQLLGQGAEAERLSIAEWEEYMVFSQRNMAATAKSRRALPWAAGPPATPFSDLHTCRPTAVLMGNAPSELVKRSEAAAEQSQPSSSRALSRDLLNSEFAQTANTFAQGRSALGGDPAAGAVQGPDDGLSQTLCPTSMRIRDISVLADGIGPKESRCLGEMTYDAVFGMLRGAAL